MPFELADKAVRLLVDPRAETVVGVATDAGEFIGRATPPGALTSVEII
ncbi:MAG: hypothetical protein JNK06_18560 [Candidatus Accumulibacter phosphatis]|nr:hypothetical protein [Candidatus Accumulibacter phosphatis]